MLLAWLILALAVTAPALAADRSAARAAPLRFFFEAGDAVPIRSGETGDLNRAAIARLARVLPAWAKQRRVRFMFVGSRTALCGDTPGCNPDQQLWQKFSALVPLISEEARKEAGGIPFDIIGQVLDDELPAGVSLDNGAHKAVAIEVFAWIDDPAQNESSCAGRVLLKDSQHPRAVRGGAESQVLPLPEARTFPVGAHARVTLEPAGASKVVAVWENNRGELRGAATSVVSLAGEAIPAPIARLHVFASKADAEVEQFERELGEVFAPIARRPSFFAPGLLTRSASKGLGDNIEPAFGPFRPLQRIAATYCHFTFHTFAN
jgi:hypothetical protein